MVKMPSKFLPIASITTIFASIQFESGILRMNQALPIAVIALALSGCATLFPQTSCAPAPMTPTAAETNPAVADALTQKQEDQMWDLSTKSIYFDSGSYTIKPEYQDFLAKVYRFLRATPELSIGLIGNADERGHTQSTDGQRRANAVKQAFRSLGLSEDRIQTVSLGDKNPRATCHHEKCWAQNRRVDIVFLGATTASNKSMPTMPAR
jgi:peptidoglycan-associated lipoprotein